MNAIIKGKELAAPKLTYPVLMRLDSDKEAEFVVLFVNSQSGYKIVDGKMSGLETDWIPADKENYWIKFDGIIELSN